MVAGIRAIDPAVNRGSNSATFPGVGLPPCNDLSNLANLVVREGVRRQAALGLREIEGKYFG